MTYLAFPGLPHSKQRVIKHKVTENRIYNRMQKLEHLKEAIERITGHKWDKVISRDRHKEFVRIRQIIAIVMYEPFIVTAVMIGEWLDGRDHSCVFSAMKNANDALKVDDEFKALYNAIVAYL